MNSDSVSTYEAVLGIPISSSINDIKKAYRNRAKELHPDRNKNPDAHQQFILLTEAYDYFVRYKDGSINNYSSTYDDWIEIHQQQARARAREYARMRYEDYINSDEFKAVTAVSTIFDFIGFIILACFILSLAFVAGLFAGPAVFSIVLLLEILLFYIFRRNIKDVLPDFRKAGDAVLLILRSKTFWFIAILISNLLLFLNIATNTLISHQSLLGIFLIFMGGTYSIMKWMLPVRNEFWSFFTWSGLSPLAINLFFLVNYIFSSNPVNEQYRFVNEVDNTLRSARETTLITLENNVYDEYIGIRFFMEYDQMRNSRSITYTIKEGLFGYRVMTGFQFH